MHSILSFLRVVYRYTKKRLLPPDPNSKSERVKPWFKINGDKTLRIDYPSLCTDSLVLDLGGYEGQWASDIFSKYGCNILIFEPYIPYFETIQERFKKNDKIKVFDFGLAMKDGELDFFASEDSSSAYRESRGEPNDKIKIVQAKSFFEQNNINKIDLMKINIEGGEFDLLDHLIECGGISKIKNIQVQFHDFVDDAEPRMEKIQRELAKTHEVTYQYTFIWENWELIGS